VQLSKFSLKIPCIQPFNRLMYRRCYFRNIQFLCMKFVQRGRNAVQVWLGKPSLLNLCRFMTNIASSVACRYAAISLHYSTAMLNSYSQRCDSHYVASRCGMGFIVRANTAL